jgi:predicted aspartyl protease
MGKITTHLTIINRGDQILAEDGFIRSEQVRIINIEDALVDTGATTLCLPAPLIVQLGLRLLKEVDIATSQGLGRARVFQDAKVQLLGREGTFECLEVPADANVLLGVIPLEMLGIEPDLQTQTLRLLPLGPHKSYLTA